MSRRRLLQLTAATSLVAGLLPRQAFAQESLDSVRLGAWGMDLGGMDRSVAPGTDFYGFANGAWLRNTTIPDNRSNVGMFYTVRELVDARVRDIIADATANPSNERERQIGALYQSFMDEARLDALDAAPVLPLIREISTATTRAELAAIQGRANFKPGGVLFGFGVGPDDREPSRNVIFGSLAGLGLPEREYYLSDSFAEHRTRYVSYLEQLFGLVDWPDPPGAAAAVLAYETEIAREHWPIEDLRDPIKTYNALSFRELAQQGSEFPWREFTRAAGLDHWRGKVVFAQASALAPVCRLYARTPISTLKAWAAAQALNQSASTLSRRFDEASFDFNGRFMQGQPQQQERWRRGVALVNASLAHNVGRAYAERYFTPDTKAKMDDLVANVIAAMRSRIEALAWMSADTKTQALDKLGKFRANIGYPSAYRDFSGLRISADDLFGNVLRTNEFAWRWSIGKLDRPVDREEWSDTPQTVNAYYRGTRNDITFPAGILQPPFFDPEADPAINYGAIGAIIGHEISHGFDDQGRMSDGDGVLREWWTGADAAEFERRTDRFVAQLDAYEPLPGARVNGRLALGESVADLAGLTVGLDAYRASLRGQAAPVLDGFTGDQRVFLGWAQGWRMKFRDAFLRQLIATDEHPPGFIRVNGIVRNIDAWYEAFNIQPNEPLYLAPSERVHLW